MVYGQFLRQEDDKLPTNNWKNKKGTADRRCKCGSWKKHWEKFSEQPWPDECSVEGCTSAPELGGHVINPSVSGEWIVPLCDACNKREGVFSLKRGVVLIKANRSETCGE